MKFLAAACCTSGLLLSACGLFFEGEPLGTGGASSTSTDSSSSQTTGGNAAGGAGLGGNGIGGAGAGGAGVGGSGGAGGGAVCGEPDDCASYRLGTDAAWSIGFDESQLADATLAGGRLYFAGSALAGATGGLPCLAGSGQRLFVASVNPEGCDLEVRDLGAANGNGEVRLSHEAAGPPLVVRARSNSVCSFPADLATSPEDSCPLGAVFDCSATGLSEPVIVASTPAVLGLTVQGTLQCTAPVVTAPSLNGVYALSAQSAVLQPLLRPVSGSTPASLRASAGAGEARFTLSCESGSTILDADSCAAAGSPRALLLRLPSSGATPSKQQLTAVSQFYQDVTTIATPSADGYALVTTVSIPSLARTLVWELPPNPRVSFNEASGDFSVSSAVRVPAGQLIAGGASRGFGPSVGDDIQCPNAMPSCDPFAYWARLDETSNSLVGKAHGLIDIANCGQSAAATAASADLVGSDVVMTMRARCGRLDLNGPAVGANGGFFLLREALQ